MVDLLEQKIEDAIKANINVSIRATNEAAGLVWDPDGGTSKIELDSSRLVSTVTASALGKNLVFTPETEYNELSPGVRAYLDDAEALFEPVTFDLFGFNFK